jgi:hypothetical protein
MLNFDMNNLSKETDSNLQPKAEVESNLKLPTTEDSSDIWSDGEDIVDSNLDQLGFYGKVQLHSCPVQGTFDCYVRLIGQEGKRYMVQAMVLSGDRKLKFAVQTIFCPLPFDVTFTGKCVIHNGSWAKIEFKELAQTK